MPRLMGVDVPGNKRIEYALRYIHGIGPKRAMDIVLAGMGLLVALVPMGAIALAMKLTSPGPVFYRQERVGLCRRTFTMYKFRSMAVDTSGGDQTAWSRAADSRRTPVGAVLRKLSLDELPQLWNVLRGDMSIVGPRPELPHFVEKFREEVPMYMLKHLVRPGITGWAQVKGWRGTPPLWSGSGATCGT